MQSAVTRPESLAINAFLLCERVRIFKLIQPSPQLRDGGEDKIYIPRCPLRQKLLFGSSDNYVHFLEAAFVIPGTKKFLP
jgi:hypothetical protein